MARPTKPRFAPQRWWSHPHAGSLWSLATHPDHDALLAGGEAPHGALWSLAGGAARPLGDVPARLRDAAWVDAATVVLVVEDGAVGDPPRPATVLVRDLTGAASDRVVARLPDAGFRAQLSVDRAGRHAVVNTSRAVHLVSLRDDAAPREIEAFQGDRAGVICGALSPDGSLCLAARGAVDGARLYDVASGARVRDLGGQITNGIVAARFDPTGTLAAALTLSERSRLVVWNVADGSVRFTREGDVNPPPALAFSPDGTRLAYSDAGHRVLLVDTADGAVLARTKTLDGFAFRLAFTRDGSVLYAADGTEVHAIPVTGAAPAAPMEAPAGPRAWTTLRAGNDFRYHTGGCVDAEGHAWIVGQNGSVLRSRDEGLTWTPVPLGKRPYLNGACQAADGALHVHGHGVIATLRDGAAALCPLPGKARVVGMAASPEVTVAATHDRLYLRAPRADAWERVDPAALRGGWHQALAVDDRGSFLLASGSLGSGFIARGDASATGWERLPVDGAGAFWCVACDGPRVYAGDDAGAIVRSDDRGARWRRLPTPVATGRCVALAARGGVVYAAFDSHAVYRSDDGGERWERVLDAWVAALVWTPRGRVLAIGDGPLYGCVDGVR